MYDTLSMWLLVIVIFSCSVSFLLFLFEKSLYTGCRLPPSPPRLPLLGNIVLMNDVPHIVFEKLSKTYGKIFTFWIGRKPVVVICDEDLSRTALLQQGNEFSGRPHRYSGGLYSRRFKGIVLSDDDSGWRYRRKVACSALRRFTETENLMDKLIIAESKEFISRLRAQVADDSEIDLREDVSLSMLNIICALVFGSRYDICSKELQEIADVNAKFLNGIQCAAIVDAFPFLKYLPYKKLKWIHEFVKVRDKVLGGKYDEHVNSFKYNHMRDFTDVLIKASEDLRKQNILNEDILSLDHKIIIMGDLFLAGVETIATAFLWAILYFIKWPSQQKFIQQELDDIWEKYKTYSYDKRTEMPKTEAAISEILRLSSVAPLGVPHKATCDSALEGYQIPKGTIILFNIHAMNVNACVWESPHEFKIERFLDESGKYKNPTKGFIPFGIGKRMCLGDTLARMELFYFLSYLLSEFSLQGTNDEISLKGYYATSWSPLPYLVKLTPRAQVNNKHS